MAVPNEFGSRSLIGILLALSLAGAPATAANGPGNGSIRIFSADYFTASAPKNALEMLERVPGFSLVEPDADVRGYSGAQGNLLIDGARPSSKRVDVSEILRRIPSSAVERIELLRDGAAGADMAGHALLANVVRRRGAQLETAMQAGLTASTDGWLAPSAQFDHSRHGARGVFEIAYEHEPEVDDDSGRGRISSRSMDGDSDHAGVATQARNISRELTINWQPAIQAGEFGASFAARRERARVGTSIQPLMSSDESEVVEEDEDTRELEIGLRYERKIGERSAIELLASQRQGRFNETEDSTQGNQTELFEVSSTSGESILRAEWKLEPASGPSLRASAEAALNFLDSRARLYEDGLPVLLPGSEVRIEERRVEISVGTAWNASSHWTLEGDVRAEKSSITQTGDSPLGRDFMYVKPRLALRWDGGGPDQWRWSLSREVGQLDFADFVASASLDDGTVSAGNAMLAPDQTWRMTTSWERRLADKATLTLTWTHDRISDVVDRVLVTTPTDTFDAPGNIGDGRRDSLGLEFSADLDSVGLSGAHLRSSLLWRKSRVTDPVTGQARGISAENPFEGSIGFSQDLPALRVKWGVEFEHLAERETEYRFDRVSREWEDAGWTAFVERELGEHWRLRVEATDLAGRRFTERRENYSGPRSPTSLEELETRNRLSPGSFSLVLRRSTSD